MNSLLKEARKRLDIAEGVVKEDEYSKVFTVRLPIELIEKIENIGLSLKMKRTEVARLILTHGADDIIEDLGIKVETYGMSFEDRYALETGEITLEDYLKEKGVTKEWVSI